MPWPLDGFQVWCWIVVVVTAFSDYSSGVASGYLQISKKYLATMSFQYSQTYKDQVALFLKLLKSVKRKNAKL